MSGQLSSNHPKPWTPPAEEWLAAPRCTSSDDGEAQSELPIGPATARSSTSATCPTCASCGPVEVFARDVDYHPRCKCWHGRPNLLTCPAIECNLKIGGTRCVGGNSGRPKHTHATRCDPIQACMHCPIEVSPRTLRKRARRKKTKIDILLPQANLKSPISLPRSATYNACALRFNTSMPEPHGLGPCLSVTPARRTAPGPEHQPTLLPNAAALCGKIVEAASMHNERNVQTPLQRCGGMLAPLARCGAVQERAPMAKHGAKSRLRAFLSAPGWPRQSGGRRTWQSRAPKLSTR